MKEKDPRKLIENYMAYKYAYAEIEKMFDLIGTAVPKQWIARALRDKVEKPQKRSDGSDCWPPKYFDTVEGHRGNLAPHENVKKGHRHSTWLYYYPTLNERARNLYNRLPKLHLMQAANERSMKFFAGEDSEIED